MNGLLLSLRKQFTLATILGIPVRADIRWVFVLILMTLVTAASSYFLIKTLPGSLMLGLIATVLFFGSVLLHEFSHALVARFEGLTVVEVVLHPFGGLSRFVHVPQTPRAEFLIAIAGPAASLLIAAILGGLAAGTYALDWDILTLVLAMLALANFLIAVVNMLPGYPLDGGRVLRAFLWKQGRDLDEATALTGRFGQYIGVGACIIGVVFFVLRGEIFAGFWIILIGVFLLDSASAILRELKSEQFARVGDQAVLSYTLSPGLGVQSFIDHTLPLHRHGTFAVVNGDIFVGLFLLDDLSDVDRGQWRTMTIRDVMRPAGEATAVDSDTSIADARAISDRNGLTSIGVVGRGDLFVGLFHTGGRRRSV